MRSKLAKLACGWVVCSLWLLAPTIGAAQVEPYAREGPFVGGGFMYAVEQFDLHGLEDETGARLHATDGVGLDLRGGYRLHPNFAVEGNMQFYGDMELESDRHDHSHHHDPDVVGFNFAANAKAYPFTGRVQPYGLFGMGVGVLSIDFSGDDFDHDHHHHDTQDDAAFMLRFGGGIDVYVTPKVLIFTEASYNYLTTDLHFQGGPGIGADLIPITIGAQYRF